MGGFAGAIEEDDLGIAGDFNGTGTAGEIGEGELAQLHIVFRADGNLEAVLELVEDRLEFRAALREDGFVAIEIGGEWLEGGGPGAIGVHFAQENKHAILIGGGIFAPAGQVESFPTGVAAAGVGNHDVVSAIGHEVDFGGRGVGGVEGAVDGLEGVLGAALGGFGDIGGGAGTGADQGDAFLQEQQRRLELGIGGEAAGHGLLVE